MGDAGLCEGFVNCKLCLHDGVIGRGEDGVNAVCYHCLSCEHDLVCGGAGVLNDLNALVGEILFSCFDGCCGGVLANVIQQADLLCVGVVCEDEVHDRVCVEVVAGAGDVCARLIETFNKLCTHGVGNCGEHNGDIGVFGECLHAHRNWSCNADHEVNVICDEVGDDLLHNGCVLVAVIVAYLEGHALFLADGLELSLDVFNDLVEGSVVNIVAYANLVDLCAVAASVIAAVAAACAEGEYHCQCAYERECLLDDAVFHCFFLQKCFL